MSERLYKPLGSHRFHRSPHQGILVQDRVEVLYTQRKEVTIRLCSYRCHSPILTEYKTRKKSSDSHLDKSYGRQRSNKLTASISVPGIGKKTNLSEV